MESRNVVMQINFKLRMCFLLNWYLRKMSKETKIKTINRLLCKNSVKEFDRDK